MELEYQLQEKGQLEMLDDIRSITSLADIHFVWQRELHGLGDAIRYAHHHVNNEPFAILLGDTLIESRLGSVTRQLIEVYDRYDAAVVALEEVEPELVSRYGIIGGEEIADNVFRVSDFIEKPAIEESPSNLAIASRYVFTPEIFAYLSRVQPGKNNEIQLTDAMHMMLEDHDMYGLRFDGIRYDIGNKLDFLKTNVIYGAKRDDLGPEFRAWLKQFVENH
jgi:UTP--glucose-1-phosphate uridylyltransferase